MISLVPGTSVATTGKPQAIASNAANPKLSDSDGKMKRSAILRISEVLSGEYQLDNLLDLVIDEAMAFTHADAARIAG